MALDSISDIQSKFISDIPEDIILDVNPDDFINAPHQDIFKQISEDLGISLLPEDVLREDVLKCTPNIKTIEDEKFDVSEFFNKTVKREPPSPGSSCDSQGCNSDEWISLLNSVYKNKTEWMSPDTPPTTPPNCTFDSSPPISPAVHATSEETCFGSQDIPSNCLKLPSSLITSPIILSTPSVVSSQNDTPVMTLSPKGILQFGTATTTTPITTTTNSMPINGLIPFNQIKQEMDVKVLKRQQRMIKNRESAYLSRKKKKEYLQALENEVKKLSQQNSTLKVENEQLKIRVNELELELCRYHTLQKNSVSSVKKATALFALLFLITLNLGPLCGIFLSNQQRIEKLGTSITSHHGRSLLWMTEQDAVPFEDINGTVGVGNSSMKSEALTNQNPICPMYINKTESLRLENELRGWIFGSDKEPQGRQHATMHPKKNLPPIPRLRSYLEQEAKKISNEYGSLPDTREIQIYQGIPQHNDDLLKTIKQRADTFYVVSFAGDHLLLPASAHNKTRRPRMSLVLPALLLNDTVQPPKDHIAMMQIDCEVMNTKLVYVKESLIPSNARRHSEPSFQPRVTSHSNNTKSYRQKSNVT